MATNITNCCFLVVRTTDRCTYRCFFTLTSPHGCLLLATDKYQTPIVAYYWFQQWSGFISVCLSLIIDIYHYWLIGNGPPWSLHSSAQQMSASKSKENSNLETSWTVHWLFDCWWFLMIVRCFFTVLLIAVQSLVDFWLAMIVTFNDNCWLLAFNYYWLLLESQEHNCWFTLYDHLLFVESMIWLLIMINWLLIYNLSMDYSIVCWLVAACLWFMMHLLLISRLTTLQRSWGKPTAAGAFFATSRRESASANFRSCEISRVCLLKSMVNSSCMKNHSESFRSF